MREIVFRGKRVDNGEWVEGFLLKDTSFYGKPENHVYIFIHEQPSGCFGRDIFIEVDPATVGQHTGLTDKNGKKIFEGDIVKHYNFSVDPEHFSSGVILWNVDACRWERTDTECSERFFISSECKYEVIGNIYDNPELMGGVENVSHP